MNSIDEAIASIASTIKSIQDNPDPKPDDIVKMVALSKSLRDSSVIAYAKTIPQYKVAKMFKMTPARVSQIINWG